MYNSFLHPDQNQPKEVSINCGCCTQRSLTSYEPFKNLSPMPYTKELDHQCTNGNDETVCTKRNCPSAINLQALASQLLAIQGVIPCTATRLVLRKVPGSNITTTMEETMERAKRSLNAMTQEQLLVETRNAQQVNALINLHMTANPPPNVIPILTTIQLKVNILKSHVDTSINRRLSESQGTDGAVGNGNLDPAILVLKSDQELRDLLSTLRQKECEERVNLNFAPYQSQRSIAQSRLGNVQNKIAQLETEMERRRNAALPRSAMGNHVGHQLSDPGFGAWYSYPGTLDNGGTFGGGGETSRTAQNYESPDPFCIQVRSPKRLNLRPHVGSPETTYERPKKSLNLRSTRAQKNSDDEDCDTSNEAHRSACDKSSEEDSADEGKKKLGEKKLVSRDVSMSENDRSQYSGVSIIKLSPNVVIVVDCLDVEKKSDESADKKQARKVTTETRDDIKIIEEKKQMGMREQDKGKTEKMSKFKWGKKKNKIPEQTIDDPFNRQAEENIENKIADSIKIKTFDDSKLEKVDHSHAIEVPESVREETVRMISEIDYDSSAFRNFRDPPEKDKIIEERYKGSFTEDDSLKSASMESALECNQTPESVSRRVENYDEVSTNTIGRKDSEKIVHFSTKIDTPSSESKIQEKGEKVMKVIPRESRISISSKRSSGILQGKSNRSKFVNKIQCDHARLSVFFSGA